MKTDRESTPVTQENRGTGAPSDAPPSLSLPPEVLAACARQDVPAAHAAEFRAYVALIGERARRLAVEAEYARHLPPQTPHRP